MQYRKIKKIFEIPTIFSLNNILSISMYIQSKVTRYGFLVVWYEREVNITANFWVQDFQSQDLQSLGCLVIRTFSHTYIILVMYRPFLGQGIKIILLIEIDVGGGWWGDGGLGLYITYIRGFGVVYYVDPFGVKGSKLLFEIGGDTYYFSNV